MFCLQGINAAIQNKIIKTANKFLLAGSEFMSKMYLRQLELLYKACGPEMINKERAQ